MIWLYALGVAAAVSAGVYLVLSRDLLRSVVGVSIIASAANLVVFAAGKPSQPSPPVIPDGLESLVAQTTAPLAQALVLTAIVIGFSLICLSLFIVLAVTQKTRLNDSGALTASEPTLGDNGEPQPDEDDPDSDDPDNDNDDDDGPDDVHTVDEAHR